MVSRHKRLRRKGTRGPNVSDITKSNPISCNAQNFPVQRRRHSADETAFLLAEAVKNNVRCIAFCKTRSLVEWVYERCIAILKADSKLSHLASKVESYRGGYNAKDRRIIEQRLFQNELVGVVGTSALELGIDIGGIDLTLHCGYPGFTSLMQQSGRSGRGGKSDGQSFAIMICFSSPSEQHIWRFPKGLLSRGLDTPPSVHLNAGIVQGHMLCGGEEVPFTGNHQILTLLNICDEISFPLDNDLFGSKDVYDEAIAKLLEKGLLYSNTRINVSVKDNSVESRSIAVYKTHPVSSRIDYSMPVYLRFIHLSVKLRLVHPLHTVVLSNTSCLVRSQ